MTAPVVIVGVNSWSSIAYADSYFEAKYGAGRWATLSLTEKTQLLITAFRWLSQQSTLSLAPSNTDDVVKQAQSEAAWFIYNYMDDYEKRRALISSGVKSVKILDFSESYGEMTFPSFISDMLFDYTVATDTFFPTLSRDMQDNTSG